MDNESENVYKLPSLSDVEKNFDQLCRLCGHCDDNQLMSIFDGDGAQHNLSGKISRHLASIKISTSDKLPSNVCYQCVSTLLTWDDLFEVCMEVDKRLRQILSIIEERDRKKAAVQANCADIGSVVNQQQHVQFYDSDSEPRSGHSIYADDDDNYTDVGSSVSNRAYSGGGCCENSEMIEVTSVASCEDVAKDIEEDLSSYLISVGDGEEEEDDNLDSVRIDYETSPFLFQFDSDLNRNPILVDTDFVQANQGVDNFESAEIAKSVSNLNQSSSTAKDLEKKIKLQNLTEKAYYDSLLKIDPRIDQKINKCVVENVVRFEDRFQIHLSGIHKKSAITDTEKIYFNMFGRKIEKLKSKKKLNSKNENQKLLLENLKYEFGYKIDELAECEFCGKIFDSFIELLIHIKKHRMTNEVKKNFENKILEKFVIKEGDEMFFKCNRCPYKGIWNKNYFLEHYKIHLNIEKVTCHECGKQTRTKQNLIRHIWSMHPMDDFVKNEFECLTCHVAFQQERYLRDHQLTHESIKPFICDFCGKSFRQLRTLNAHKKAELGIKCEECKICGKTFKTRSELSAHTKRHNPVKRFRCSECNKGFSLKRNLRNHMSVHSKDKPFSCDICGQKFKLKKYVTQHKRKSCKANI